jgi:uncharacterized membrane protein YfcA
MATDASSPPGAAGLGSSARWWRLAVIGLSAGLFSTLFGVGGGIIMVPLLLGLMGYEARWATSTSLAAIVFTSIAGAIAHGAFGNLHWDRALLLGVPAVGGLLIGIRINQRLSNRALTLAFAVFLVAVAVRLVLE